MGFFLVAVLIGLVCGWASKEIFKSKGRDAAGGWWIGFLLGAIGILIAAVVPAAPKDEARR